MCPFTVTTTTLCVTVVCSGASAITMTAIMAATSLGIVALGQHDVLLTGDPEGHNEGFSCPYHCVTAETTSF